jgi:hypothetical protein
MNRLYLPHISVYPKFIKYFLFAFYLKLLPYLTLFIYDMALCFNYLNALLI